MPVSFSSQDIEHLWTQLVRIADALERLVTPEPALPPELTCLHPEESRISFGLTHGTPDWQCQACGYRTVAP